MEGRKTSRQLAGGSGPGGVAEPPEPPELPGVEEMSGMAVLYPFSSRTAELLAVAPAAGSTHRWLAQVASGLCRVLTAERCAAFLRRCCEVHVTHRRVPEREIAAAVGLAYGRGAGDGGRETGSSGRQGTGDRRRLNYGRGALAIRSLGSEDVFELRAAKRGKRLRWTDAEGRPTNVQYIAHHGAPGVICWRQATAEEVAEVTGAGGAASNGRPRQFEPVEAVHAVLKAPGLSGREYQRRLVMRLGCSASRAWQLLQEAVNSGWMEKRGTATFRRFVVTVAGEAVAQNKTSEFDWVFTCTENRSQSVSEQAFRNPLTTT